MSGTLQNGSFYGGVRSRGGVSGLTLAETTYDPGFVVPPHEHVHPFFCLTLRGSFAEWFESRSWTATPATVFYHPAGAEHGEEFGDGGGRLFNIQFSGEWLARFASVDLHPPQHQVHATGGSLARIATALLDEYRTQDTASDLVSDDLALALLAEVVGPGAAREGPEEYSRPGWLNRAEAVLQDRVGKPMDIASIAAEVDVHPVYLARVFRRHYGCSPGERLRRIRIQRACRLLADSKEPLSSIAYATGYADQSHFTRHFKRAMGVTPGRYRQLVS